MIENIKKDNIRPCSVDTRINKVFKIESKGIVDIDKNMPKVRAAKLPYVLKSGEYVLASTIEKIKEDRPQYGCIAVAKSKAYRIGLSIQSGHIHPFYHGQMVFGIKNIENSD